MEEIIVNKVAQSSLETIDLEKFYPEGETIVFDMKDHLFMELILKEKDYRENLKKMDWSVYENKNVCITCSADAIIPLWAYMLAVSYLQPVVKDVIVGNESFMHEVLFCVQTVQAHWFNYLGVDCFSLFFILCFFCLSPPLLSLCNIILTCFFISKSLF